MKHDIVCARVLYPNGKNIITNNREDISYAIEHNYDYQLLTRQHMQLMASADLGINWENMAKSRTIFFMEEKDNKLMLFYPATLTLDDKKHFIPFESDKSFVESIEHYLHQLNYDDVFIKSTCSMIADKINQ